MLVQRCKHTHAHRDTHTYMSARLQPAASWAIWAVEKNAAATVCFFLRQKQHAAHTHTSEASTRTHIHTHTHARYALLGANSKAARVAAAICKTHSLTHTHTRRLSEAQKQRRDCNVDGDCDCDAATSTAQQSSAQSESECVWVRERETAGGMTLSVAQFFRGFAFPLRYACVFVSPLRETRRWECVRENVRAVSLGKFCFQWLAAHERRGSFIQVWALESATTCHAKHSKNAKRTCRSVQRNWK